MRSKQRRTAPSRSSSQLPDDLAIAPFGLTWFAPQTERADRFQAERDREAQRAVRAEHRLQRVEERLDRAEDRADRLQARLDTVTEEDQ